MLVDGKCVRADPFVNPDKMPSVSEATEIEDYYLKVKAQQNRHDGGDGKNT